MNEQLAVKRIPVTEKVWHELGDLKGAGQSYDELIEKLLEEHKKNAFVEMIKHRRSGKFTKVDTSKW